MRLGDYDYPLPEELIAQEPLEKRDRSRLLVADAASGRISHRHFFEITDYLEKGDLLVFNDTRVVATRLFGNKRTGGKVEALLTERLASGLWRAIVKPGRRVQVGAELEFEGGLRASVEDRTVEGGRILRFSAECDPEEIIAGTGKVPLPPYIHRELEDPERYQTVYATDDGSAAAPTAGLHFTPELLDKIRAMGVKTCYVTLHVGIATFRPVRTEDIRQHEMHSEYFEITAEEAEKISSAAGRVVCVGTTTARALESAAVERGKVAPFKGETDLFITPGYDFKVVDALITNFHVPKSTLLVLVSAFAGGELIRRAYSEALDQRYRFLSFGDAMFLYQGAAKL